LNPIPQDEPGWGKRFWYALPAFALAVPTVPVFVYLPKFYAQDMGLGLATTGAVLLVARIVDIVSDPVIGLLSDRAPLRLRGISLGRRKPWIAIGGVLAFIALLRLFNPGTEQNVVEFLGWVTLLYVGWTMVSIPYSAWGAELSTDYHGRAKITAARETATLAGILISGGVPVVGVAMGLEEGEALALLSWLTAIIGTVTIMSLLWRVPETGAPELQFRTRAVGWEFFQNLIRNRPFLRLVAAWFMNGLANGLPAVLFLLYMEHALGADSEQRASLILTYFVSAVAGIPLWMQLSRHWSKHRTWCAAMIIACAAFVVVPFISEGEIFPFGVVCVLTGLALGADLYLPPAMQADLVDLDELRSRERNAGIYFALWGMATKLALACAVGFAFTALDALGFDPANQNSDGIIALILIYSAIPVVLKGSAILMVWNHPIDKRRHGIIRRRLASRRIASVV
jgi:GPH family glycoside/pentoside/hexuronide:cation symporter